MNILAELRGRLAEALADLLDEDPAPYVAMLKPAQDPKFGDFQANCAMPLAKRRQSNPRNVAGEIVEKLDVDDLCLPPEIAGPGFINFRIRDEWLTAQTEALVEDERLGVAPVADPEAIVVDYSAPNVAKPMHVGHLRSSVIGDCLCRVLRFLGHRVVSDNHVGDWGTQFGMIIYGYKHFRDEEAFRQEPVAELARLYRLVNQLSEYQGLVVELPALKEQFDRRRAELESAAVSATDKAGQKQLRRQRSELAQQEQEIAAAEEKCAAVENDPQLSELAASHPEIAEAARRETAKLHAGDAENVELWRSFLPECLAALDALYARLGIEFDLTLGESHYQPMLSGVVEDLAEKSLARESDGAVCVFVEGNEAPFIIKKRDGAFTYATTDLATIRYRIDQLNADVVLYVVDARQSEHFNLLFATARAWGYTETEFRHVSFGTILGDDRRPFKTRAGDTVGLESLLDEAIARARVIVDANDDAKDEPELGEAARQRVAEIVGIGGIKYADLHHNRESDYVFSWDKMLAKTGDTATYVQYAHARVCSILRKGGVDRAALRRGGGRLLLEDPAERALALQINRFAEAVADVTADDRPNLLTQYLFETAKVFSTFFEQCHVLRERDERRKTSRLLLCDLTARALALGLELLGIRAPEEM